MLPFALLAFFFIVLGGEREGARAAACDTGFFQRGVLDPAPPPSALLPPRSRKVERFGSSNAIEEETTRNWRQRSESCSSSTVHTRNLNYALETSCGAFERIVCFAASTHQASHPSMRLHKLQHSWAVDAAKGVSP